MSLAWSHFCSRISPFTFSRFSRGEKLRRNERSLIKPDYPSIKHPSVLFPTVKTVHIEHKLILYLGESELLSCCRSDSPMRCLAEITKPEKIPNTPRHFVKIHLFTSSARHTSRRKKQEQRLFFDVLLSLFGLSNAAADTSIGSNLDCFAHDWIECHPFLLLTTGKLAFTAPSTSIYLGLDADASIRAYSTQFS